MTIELEQNPGQQFSSLERTSRTKQIEDSEGPLGVNIVVTESKSYI